MDGKRCGAQLRKKPGQFCQRWPQTGSERCRLHGGASRSGVAHPNFRHGRHSKHFPATWGSLEDLLADQNLRSIALDLVALDRRMGEIMERAAGLKGDSAKARAWEEYRDLAETRSRLIDAESRRMERGQSSIPEVQARALFRALSLAVRKEVEDTPGLDGRAFLARLQQRFDLLMGRSRLKVIQAQTEADGRPAGDEGTTGS